MRPALSSIRAALLLAVTLALAAAGCSGKADPPAHAPEPLKGFGLSPRGFPLDYGQFPAFFAEIGQLPNGAAMFNGAWYDAAGTAGTAPAAATVVEDAAATSHFTPIVVFGWRTGPGAYLLAPSGGSNDWTNATTRAAFQSMLTAFAAAKHPPYVFLGNESDFYFEEQPGDYANWIAAYNSAYDAIKAASPATRVGPVFNFEHLSGTGALVGFDTARWQALDDHDFSRVDLVALTVYPFFHYAAPESVPSTYLDAVTSHLQGKPFAITETGWPAENLGALDPAWDTSTAAQVTYVAQLQTALSGKGARFVNWLYLNPMVDPGGSPTEWKEFGSISVRDDAGAERPAYAAFKALSF